MANFSSNHSRGGRRGGGSNFFKNVILFLVAFLILFFLFLLIKGDGLGKLFESKQGSESPNYELPNSGDRVESRYFLPSGSKGDLVHHSFYSLSYVEKYEQAEWVAYELTRESLIIKNVPRTNWFQEDEKVPGKSASYYDYKGSGYTRGHLAPAGDMAFSEDAMKESFFMSNISPQTRPFNNGVWKELEESIRDWAFTNNRLYVVTGPVLSGRMKEWIGKNKVAVPRQFYKVLLDINDPEHKAIAFLIPNEKSNKPIMEYSTTVDAIEELTGLDFFSGLMSDRKEEKIEASINKSKWKVSEKRFNLRVAKWNNQK